MKPPRLRPVPFLLNLFCAILLASGLPAQTPAPAANSTSQAVTSPDGKIEVTVTTRSPLTYRVALDGKTLLNESRLGLKLRDGIEMGREVELVKAERNDADTRWTNPLGKRRDVRDHHRELVLTFREKSAANATFQVAFRVFDDGVGFRYQLPSANGAREVVVEEELTQFAFPGDHTVYAGDHIAVPAEDYDTRGGFAGSQEWEYRKQRLSDLAIETVTGLPALIHAEASWVAITEADLLDWSALWLAREVATSSGVAVTLRARLAPRLDGNGLVKAALPHNSPWRVLMIGREAGRLVESDLVLNLSTPSQLADTSWIKPGLMAWDRWWPGVGGPMTTSSLKQFIEFAGEMGWPYQLIDAGWYTNLRSPNADIIKVNPRVDMPELLRFAKERGVRLWLWLYWTDADQNDAYKKAFAEYEKWGIAGVKIDFMDRDDQEMVNWYEKITRAAAEHHLMVNFHGAYKPTGLIRTWPNQITREGILGNEYNKWSRRVTAEHRVMLPFTRYLAGPGDFTPGGFLNRMPDQFATRVTPTQVLGTRANQLALFVAYDSPIMCVSDHPYNLRDQPGIDFLKVVPTVWDETRVLSGFPGEHLVMARRSGKDWFVGALNNDFGRVKSVKLDFLGTGSWKVRWWRDARDSGVNAEHVDHVEQTVSANDTLDLRMTPGGGAVLHFTAAQ